MKKTGGTNLRQRLLNDFTIDFNSEVDGRCYKGKFVSKKLSIRDIGVLGVRKSQLNGGMHYSADKPGFGVNEDTDEFNNMLAHLDIALVEYPDWWNLDEITDVQLLGEVYQKVIAFENTFLRRRRGASDDSSGSDGGGEGRGPSNPPQTNETGTAAKMVVEEVSDALEP